MRGFLTDVAGVHTLFRSIGAFGIALALIGPALGKSELPLAEAAKFLPETIENLRAKTPPQGLSDDVFGRSIETTGIVSAAVRDYTNSAGLGVTIALIRTDKDSAAYALLTQLAQDADSVTSDFGTASVASSTQILFCKGDAFVGIKATGAPAQAAMLSVAKSLAAALPEGDDEPPVLVRHLPDGQTSRHPLYAVSLNQLKNIAPNQPIFDYMSFEGGTEAVTANYGPARLVIVEFTTPQFAGDNDRAITAKIQELKSQNQPGPSAYRRVGNYSVFVFNAPNEGTANDLIDQVKYQKVVQWLGEDPHLYEKLEKYLAQTSAGVLIAVLESSGLSLIVCFGLGALFGTLLFRYRRAQRATRYSDAGGSVRLNLDELTSHGNSRGLLKSSSPRESPSKHS
jgi:hypothetical protein